MLYADYAYYSGTYYGKMTEADFNRTARRASAYLDRVTFGRITSTLAATDAVKDACCAVADAFLTNETTEAVASENNDGLSVTYRQDVENKRLKNAARLYLSDVDDDDGTPLLYRGVV